MVSLILSVKIRLEGEIIMHLERSNATWIAALAGLAVLSAGWALAASPPAAPTPTLALKAALGVAVEPGDGGAKLKSVTPGSTAAAAGLAAGDTLVSINGASTPAPADVVRMAQSLRAGDPVRFTFRRDGATRTSAPAPALGKPLERYNGAAVRYGAVPFRGGLLRDIMVTPNAAGPNTPVVFLIQGYPCQTIEGDALPYGQFAQGLADRGIATYRVEKPGQGDSQGGPDCLQSDFDTELDAFRVGLAALTKTYKIDPKRIVLFGHSMGGVQAPILAAESGPMKGVAVMGTVARNWRDYMQDLFRLQAFFGQGGDPADSEELAELMRPLMEEIFAGTKSLEEIADAHTEFVALMRGPLQWDGKELILYRSLSYWRGVGNQRLAKNWSAVQAPVLALYGESDFAAIDDRDHRLIVDIVNYYRPGTARFAVLDKTGHVFGLEGARDAARAFNKANSQGLNLAAPYSPQTHTLLADWVLGLGQ
jgi:pimeloyl-ACP methyl ester carboxylesterase